MVYIIYIYEGHGRYTVEMNVIFAKCPVCCHSGECHFADCHSDKCHSEKYHSALGHSVL